MRIRHRARAARRPSRIVFAAVAIAAPAAALATDFNWNNAAGGSFITPGNWMPAGPPATGSDNAIFNLGSASGYTVSFTTGPTNNGLRVVNDTTTLDLNGNTYALAAASTTSGSASLLLAANSGNNAALTVTDGTLSLATGFVGVNGTGTLNVSSSGILTASGNLIVGNLGTGTLNVINSGDVNHSGITVGSAAGSTGTVNITGSGSTLNGSIGITVGQAGTGAFNAANSVVITSAAVSAGSQTGSSGAINITGASSWTASAVSIGASGTGSLAIRSGSVLSGTSGTVGSTVGSSGEVLISGSGSAWNSGGTLTIGSGGAGTLRVENGGSVSSVSVNLASGVSATADITLTGTGSIWNSSGGVTVGGIGGTQGGSATLTIETGATFSTSSSLRIHPTGTVNLNGGTLSFNSATLPIAGVLNFNSGTLNLTGLGSVMTIGAAGLLGPVVQLDASRRITVTNAGGNATINSDGLLILSGGSLSAPTTNNSGEIQLASASSILSGTTLSNSGKVLGTGRVTGALTNNAAGEVRASDNERLVFTAASNSNSGKINLVDGGTVEFTGALTNAAAGRIAGRGKFIASGTLTNNGQVSMSAGFSDIFGPVTNNNKILITGGGTTTFYDAISNAAAGNINVAANSAVVFLSSVTGSGTLTGSGTKYFSDGSSALTALDTAGETVVDEPAHVGVGHVREVGLDVKGVMSIAANGTNFGTSRVTELDVSGQLDLSNNKLIVVGGSVGTFASGNYTGVSGMIQAGYNSGGWDGNGIITSQPAAHNSLTTLAIATAEQASLAGGTFGGLSVPAADVLVMYTYAGDANLDGTINPDDYANISFNDNIPGASGYYNGDFNYDGDINADDFALIDFNFNAQGAPFPISSALQSVTVVPEPVLALALPALAGILCSRRRKLDVS